MSGVVDRVARRIAEVIFGAIKRKLERDADNMYRGENLDMIGVMTLTPREDGEADELYLARMQAVMRGPCPVDEPRAPATIGDVLDLADATGSVVRRDSLVTYTHPKDNSIQQSTGPALDQWGWALECPRKPGEPDDADRNALLLCCRWEHDSVEEWEAARKAALER